MEDGVEDKGSGGDFYSVLGLHKECSTGELKTAYKKLALRWHPDRCSASGSTQVVDQATNKFQEIQEAYSVLSDCNKRLMYDVGFYHSDDDDNNNGMGDFLGEMAAMMNEYKPDPGKNVQESFQELQDLFVEMFQTNDAVSSDTESTTTGATKTHKPPLRTASLPANLACMPRGSPATATTLKRDCADTTFGVGRSRTAPPAYGFADPFFMSSSGNGSFCFGVASGVSGKGSGRHSAPSPQGAGGNGKSPGIPFAGGGRRSGRKQKVSSRQGVSSGDSRGGVSAS